MAETVYLNDGSMEVILEDTGVFLEKLIREKPGDDAARCFTEYISELEYEAKAQQELTEEQERSADGYLQMLHSACDSFSAIMALLEAPRLNRDALTVTAQNAFNAIWKNL